MLEQAAGSNMAGEASEVPRTRTGSEHLISPDLRLRAPVFVRGEGLELIGEDGRRYLDAASGVGVTCLGYSVPEVAEAIRAQADTLQYLHALRFEAPPVRELAERVAALTPRSLGCVFFASGGSEAAESSFKFARQYWLERGQPERWRIIGRWPSFHGNTLATLSAGWHATRRKRHAPLLLPFSHVEMPNTYRGCGHCRQGGSCSLACADELERAVLKLGPETVAAFIAEPVVAAAAGAMGPPADYFTRIREICDRHEILLIADEVVTGFGRLGRWFGSQRLGIEPDIVVFAKGISAGFAPLGGFAAHTSLVDAMAAGSGRFEHNFTFAGHPVAAAAGLAVLRIIERDKLVEHVAALEGAFFDHLKAHVGGLPIVGDVRGMGFLAGVELVADRATKAPFAPGAAAAYRAASLGLEEGVVVYPGSGGVDGEAGDYLLLMPPFVAGEQDLERMCRRLGRALERLGRDLL
jgi:adenosylmethionine-8-amino-7-oxononanoate aminotransferase